MAPLDGDGLSNAGELKSSVMWEYPQGGLNSSTSRAGFSATILKDCRSYAGQQYSSFCDIIGGYTQSPDPQLITTSTSPSWSFSPAHAASPTHPSERWTMTGGVLHPPHQLDAVSVTIPRSRRRIEQELLPTVRGELYFSQHVHGLLIQETTSIRAGPRKTS